MQYFNKLRKWVLALSILLYSSHLFSQEMDLHTEEPSDFMHSNGKIFVVMAVVITIVTGLVIYLINLDRKIGKMEKKLTETK